MPEFLPPVTHVQRQRLQKLWEEARAVMAQAGSPPGRKDAEKIHDILSQCVAGDPANTVYLDALLMNLRLWRSYSKPWWWFWIPRLIWDHSDDLPPPGWDKESVKSAMHGLKYCKADKSLVELFVLFADKCREIDAPEAEIRYLQEALHYALARESVLVKLSNSLLRQGRFDEARSTVDKVIAAATKSAEVAKVLAILDGPVPPVAPRTDVLSRSEIRHSPADYLELAAAHVQLGHFDEAEAAAAKAQSLSGGDLAVREQAEAISLDRLENNVAIARRLVEHDPSPAHQLTLRRWEEELGRLELATLHARSERFPQDAGLKLEVAVRLKRAGNYSGAIQRLEEISADHSLRPSVLTELGECWQHLRQFDKALDLYTEAIAAAEEREPQDALHLALYRAGSLASAMQRTDEAKAAFQRLVTQAPDFKDAHQRLLLLDT
ncbi:MAG: tetratricopeptide repeat protein [Pirellulaceae bacterium]|nr:tetratricopeptide repeat protein [Pirellulaceae bacterium]